PSPTLPVRRRRVVPATEGATALATVEAPVETPIENPVEPSETGEEVAAAPIPVEPDGRQDGAAAEAEDEVGVAPVGPAYEPSENLAGDLRRVPLYLSPLPYAILAALMMVVMGNLTVMFTAHDTSADAALNGNGYTFCFNCNNAQGFDWWAPSR